MECTQSQFWKEFDNMAGKEAASGKIEDKIYRNFVKDFCNEFKLKLYVGKAGNLKEYDGTW